MKQWRFFCLCLITCMITACESLGVPPQSSNPSVTEPSVNTLLLPPTEQEQITFPQMTQTALAFPTVPFVIEPTQTSVLPSANDTVIKSPDGKYAVACKQPSLILLNAQTNEIISSYNASYRYDCEQQIHWSPDSSYATFAIRYDSIMRWRPDGSQPELLHVNIVEDLNYSNCHGTMLWSPDGHFLAVDECGIYVFRPFDESSFQNPLLIEKTYYEDFRWATSRLLIVEYHRFYDFYDLRSDGIGDWVGGWSKDGMGCMEQPPYISPNEHWLVLDSSEYRCGISGEKNIYQYFIVDLEQAAVQIFSNTTGNLIDFIGWSKDSQEFYFISRPINSHITADQRTPFGLLAMNPQTLQVDNIFEEAQFAAFNDDLSQAYIVFPARNDDGSLRFDGALWQVGTTELRGRQIMFNGFPKENQFPRDLFAYMVSAAGENLEYSSNTTSNPHPALWSYDNQYLATINADRQLIVMNPSGEILTSHQLSEERDSSNTYYVWSHNNTRIATVDDARQLIVIDLNGQTEIIAQLDDTQFTYAWDINWSDDDKFIKIVKYSWSVP